MKTGHLYQQFLDEPRCAIARKLLSAERKTRATIKRLEVGPRVEGLIVLLVGLEKLRRAHEIRCPRCAGGCLNGEVRQSRSPHLER